MSSSIGASTNSPGKIRGSIMNRENEGWFGTSRHIYARGFLGTDENIYFKQADNPYMLGFVFTVGPNGMIELVHSTDIHTEWQDSDNSVFQVPKDTPAELLSFVVTEDISTSQGSWAIQFVVTNTTFFNTVLDVSVAINGTKMGNEKVTVNTQDKEKVVVLSGALLNPITANDTISVSFAAERNGLTLNGDVSPTSALVRKTEPGTMASNFRSYAWEDLKVPFFGRKLDVTQGVLDYDFAELAISFPTNSDIDDYDALSFIEQLPHRWKLETELRPHLHYYTTSTDVPNWLIKYRVYKNGDEVPSTWQVAKWENVSYTYDKNGEQMLQIAKFPAIDMAGIDVVSAFIDVKLFRDNANDSGLFAGPDPYSGDVLAKEFIIHYMVDSVGSKLEYIK